MEIEHVDAKVLTEEKERTSFNLSKDTLKKLDLCWMEIRHLSGSKRISKTLIMEVAFGQALCEFNEKKEKSEFYKDLLWMLED